MTGVHFLIRGKIKPYVRMTQKSKFVDPQAREYLASKDVIKAQLRATMARKGWEMLPAQTPLQATIFFNVPGWLHCSDLDNQVKAVLDAAQGVVFKNDCWVDAITARRFLNRGTEPHTTLVVEPLFHV
ncbi:MAG: RusA family crossover junction endodeoxyribonuclease [Planctomycetota bacterium]|jgi:Holliday junction resolvase RusA-like endonuclease